MLTETLQRISFSVVGRCADLSLAARINLSPADFGIILQNHRRLPLSIFSVKIAALGSLNRVTGRKIVKISKFSNFKGASLNFEFDFSVK
jgi:hypothetical protein